MKFIKENPMKFLSVQLPIYGAFFIGVLPVMIEKAMQTQIIPAEHHAFLMTVILPILTILGRMIKQPSLNNKETD